MDFRYPLVLLCFFVSGFAGLLYETAWTREFSFVFGTSNLAVATVLAAYMAGLSLGASLAARWMHRIRRPVLVYGLLELGIAASALAVPLAIRGVSGLYRLLFASAQALPEEGGLGPALFYAVASFVILGIPTTMMGATLPMLARHAVREESQIGRRVGTLYAVNTAGAIAGTIATAFLVLPALGLRQTVWVGAALNAVVFAGAALLARGVPLLAAGSTPARGPGPGGRAVLAVAFASSVAAFLYENLWFRLFEHVLGASIYAFSTMLAGFLLGIAIGGGLAAPFARTRDGAARGLAASQLGAAAFSFLAFAWADQLPELALRVNETGLLGVLARAGVAAALLLPSTLCIGASFPFAVRALAERADDAAAASARVYAWNTLGAILGSLAAGFVVIPALGFERTLVVGVIINLTAAGLAGATARPVARPLLAATAACALALLLVRPEPPWRVLATGPLGLDTWRQGSGALDPSQIAFYAVGRSSTVLMIEEPNRFRLRTNGLPEATIERLGALPGRANTQRWLTVLPAFAPTQPRDLLVIGLGGGVALEDVPRVYERIDVIEIEPEVLAANRLVAPHRSRDPLADPRVHVLLNDGRGALTLTERRWGAIVSQPSHPWTAGASHLYTRDFFSQIREHLAPGGVFVQWMGLQFVDEYLLRSLIATLADVFEHVSVYQADPFAVLLAASDRPLDLDPQVDAVVAADPDTFGRLGIAVREDIAAALVLDAAGVRAVSAGAPLTTDDHNLLATQSPRVLAKPIRRVDRLFGPHDPLPARAGELDVGYLVRRLVRTSQLDRAKHLAESLPDRADRLLANAELALARGERRSAQHLAAQALAVDPDLAGARFRVDSLAPNGGVSEDPVLTLLAAGQRLRGARDWGALAALDPELAALDPRHAGHGDAQHLRVDWRLGSGSPQAAGEALAILEREYPGVEMVARRALAGVRSGTPGVARQSLNELSSQLKRARPSPLAAEWALAALDAVPGDELPKGAARLRKRLGLAVPRR